MICNVLGHLWKSVLFQTSLLVVGNENYFRAVFSFFYEFLTVLTNFQFMCCLADFSFLSKFSVT